MFNFNIDFVKVMKENILFYLITPVRLNRLKAMIKPLKIMFSEFTAMRAEFTYKCQVNSEIIYLEMALNDHFDNTLRGIYILGADYPKVYIYKKSESKPAIILYKKWNSTIAFALGKFCFYQGDIYEATTANTNKVPGVDPEWTIRPARKAPILRKKANYNGLIAFYVMVPSYVTFSTDEMKSKINYYKLGGPGYQIKIF